MFGSVISMTPVAVTVVLAVAVLFAEFESAVRLLTVAVSLIVPAPVGHRQVDDDRERRRRARRQAGDACR